MNVRYAAMAGLSALALTACSQPSGGAPAGNTTGSSTDGANPQAPNPQPASPPPPSQPTANAGGPAGLTMQAINQAQFSPTASTGPGGDANATGGNTTAGASNTTGSASMASPGAQLASPALIRAEVLLDRANFAPGVIDGQMGENVSHALVAYQAQHGLPSSSTLDEATWKALTAADGAPVLKAYTITPQDAAGPWSANVGENFVAMSKLPALGYTSAQEMLAERFHMDQDLLKTLNPQADFSKAGTTITVVDPGQETLPKVDHITVDKLKEQVIAYGEDNKVVAVFPATVGSTERPSPKGTWKVKGVAQHPDYVYDPSKLTWGPKHAGKLHIPPGPNNPVGIVWIALTAPDYGIHGTPDPHTIGKTASHGCVRLTNWDAEELSKAVRPGVKVTFEHS